MRYNYVDRVGGEDGQLGGEAAIVHSRLISDYRVDCVAGLRKIAVPLLSARPGQVPGHAQYPQD